MAACASCGKELTLQLPSGNDSDDGMIETSVSHPAELSVPDDCELDCGCHFHWECLLDAYEVTECPQCRRNVSSTSENGLQQVLCKLTNEGGVQEGLDILPILVEETYLKTYPDERKSRAFLEFCREGDALAIVDLLKATEYDDEMEDEDEVISHPPSTILRYQDPLGPQHSGLHEAVIAGKVEVVWLLLFLASNLDLNRFPETVLQTAAQQLEISREDQQGKVDIRILRDAQGKLAAEYALETMGRVFNVDLLVPSD